MKEKLKSLGWSGWAIIGLAVVLAVGAIVAANTAWDGEVAESGDDASDVVDASDEEVKDVNAAEEEPPVVAGDTAGAGGGVEVLPESGYDGGFAYYYEW